MDADGGMSRFPGNKAGAKYGTGYCDAQCPHSVMFIMERPTVKTGTLTNRPDTMARAAISWISGRAIKYPPPTYHMVVQFKVRLAARVLLAGMMPVAKDTMAFVIKMTVTLILTDSEIRHSLARMISIL